MSRCQHMTEGIAGPVWCPACRSWVNDEGALMTPAETEARYPAHAALVRANQPNVLTRIGTGFEAVAWGFRLIAAVAFLVLAVIFAVVIFVGFVH